MTDETQDTGPLFTGIYPVDLGNGIGVCFRYGGVATIGADGVARHPPPPQYAIDEVRAEYAGKRPSPWQIAEYKRVRAFRDQTNVDVTHTLDPLS